MADGGVTHRKRLHECVGRGVPGDDPWITGVAIDSRKIKRGDLFIAYRGETTDGHRFVADAVAAGAAAVVVDQPASAGASAGASAPSVSVPGVSAHSVSVPIVQLADTRREAGHIAARFYDHPSRALGCIGVTGTNGKTSVSVHLATLLSRQGRSCAYGGTLGWGLGTSLCGGRLTTEDPVTLQRRLSGLVSARAEWAALEVSSHALAQHRADAVEFRTAVFTNLTRDHLDYHGSMADYGAAKRRLFEWPALGAAVVNLDDPFGAALATSLKGRVNLLTYGVRARADLRWENLGFGADGVNGTLVTPWGRLPFSLPLYGEFAVANFAAALGAAVFAGCDAAALIESARTMPAAPGRMQLIRRARKPTVVIDYAHTPDALAKALEAARRHAGGRVICVFGCGGDRDRGKRPLMAQAVEERADVAWVTNDNPRSEVPAQIAQDIERGFSGRIPVQVELDRRRAIGLALEAAGPGDLVLIAGKGHETYQEIGGRRLPHSDLEVAESCLGG